ncbi:MAG: pyridoxal 5'-phosphate synthase glutaminase subunit PdxT [Candidatus Acidiferrales bacterium]
MAIQGDFEAHAKMLERMGVEYRLVKTKVDLEGLDGLILPGGESTTHLKVMKEEGLHDAIRDFASSGGAIFGTCAGAILLAREVKNPPQESLGLLDAVVLRNGYGRQVASEVRSGKTVLRDAPLEMVFIRAPIFESLGKGVKVIAEDDGKPVCVQQGKILAATFHPELTSDSSMHEYFVKLARNGSSA